MPSSMKLLKTERCPFTLYAPARTGLLMLLVVVA